VHEPELKQATYQERKLIMSATSPPLILEGPLSIYTAHEIKSCLLAALQDTPALHLDLSQVTDIDSAGLQCSECLKGKGCKNIVQIK
jgi:anti-anti-sigma regulatory factor